MLRIDLANAQNRLIALVPLLTEEELDRKLPSQWKQLKGKTTMRHLLHETAEHMHEHAMDLRAWRKRRHLN
jgi:hypothetical protein